MIFEINRNLCQNYQGLDPIKLLDYPAEDVIDLINQTIAYNKRHNDDNVEAEKPRVIRKKASDNWF